MNGTSVHSSGSPRQGSTTLPETGVKVLLAEDDLTTRRTLVQLLGKWGYTVSAVGNGLEALEHLCSADPPHIAILDWMMPGLDGLEVCRRIRQERPEEEPYIYLIFLTMKNSQEDIVSGLETGADDYLVKPFDPEELRARLLAGQRTIELENQLRLVNRHLLDRSQRDALTGLLNRRAMFERFEQEIARVRRGAKSFVIGILDIDHFKQINDTFGHQVGDEVLKDCTKKILNGVREYDLVGRFGGEEFLFMIFESDRESALETAERLRETVATHPVAVGDHSIPYTVSIGLAIWNRFERIEDLIERADRALYQAKRQGRNRIILNPDPA